LNCLNQSLLPLAATSAVDIDWPLNSDSSRPLCVEILWGESRRRIRFGFGTVTGERPMLPENEGTISTQDQPTGSGIFVSVETVAAPALNSEAAGM
jgi:hypothetical protein